MTFGHIRKRVPPQRRVSIRGSIAALALALGLATEFAFPAVVGAATTVPASGGNVTTQISAKDFARCIWSSNPKVEGYDLVAKCQSVMTRVVHVPANPLKVAREFVFTIRASGPDGPGTVRMVIVEKGRTR